MQQHSSPFAAMQQALTPFPNFVDLVGFESCKPKASVTTFCNIKMAQMNELRCEGFFCWWQGFLLTATPHNFPTRQLDFPNPPR